MEFNFNEFCSEHWDLILKHFPFPTKNQTSIDVMQRESAIRSFILGYLAKEEELKTNPV